MVFDIIWAIICIFCIVYLKWYILIKNKNFVFYVILAILIINSCITIGSLYNEYENKKSHFIYKNELHKVKKHLIVSNKDTIDYNEFVKLKKINID